MSAELVSVMSRALTAARPTIDALDAYYDGEQPLSFLPPDVRDRVGERLSSLVVNWPRLVVDSLEERLDVEPDPRVQDEWTANDLDEGAQLCHLDALVTGNAYVSVWGRDDDPDVPVVSVRSSADMAVRWEPGSNRLAAALDLWQDESGQRATLYLPDRVESFRRAEPSPSISGVTVPSVWEPVTVIGHPYGVVPVVPFVNRPRARRRGGVSELADVIPLADAINKLGTDAMVTSEFHASPRRYATGLQLQPPGAAGLTEAQRRRLQAEAQDAWDAATRGKTWLAGKGVEFGQFPEAGLDGYVSLIRQFSAFIAAIAGLPPHYLGLSTDNPASAEAIRSAESSLIERAKRKQTGLGASWRRVQQLMIAVRDDVPARSVEPPAVFWRDPGTPTVAEQADAALKKVQAGLVDLRQAREDMGYSQAQIAAMEEREARAASTAATAAVEAQVAQARRLQAEEGLSQRAAYAAVGLLQAAGEITP